MNFIMWIWYLNIAAQTAVLAAILWRREAGRYKTFTTFIAFYVLRSPVTLYFSHVSPEAWARCYFVCRAIRIPLLVCVMVELFYWLARPRGLVSIRKATMWLLTFGALAATSLWMAIADPSSHPQIAIATIREMDRSSDLSLFGLLLLVFVVGRAWRVYDVRERGIALGFFVWLGVDLALEFAEYHSIAVPTSVPIRLMSLGAFLLGALIWLYHFLIPQPQFSEFGEPQYVEAQRWLDDLRKISGA